MSLDFTKMRLLIISILCLIASCNEKENPSMEIVKTFKRYWHKDYYGYGFQSRGENVFLVHKIGCDYAYYGKYWPEGDSIDYTTNKEFYKQTCEIDVKDSVIIQYFKFYMSLRIKSLDSRINRFGTVELLLPDEDCIYYIKEYNNLPNKTKKWLSEYSDPIEPYFFYVKAKNRFDCLALVYSK